MEDVRAGSNGFSSSGFTLNGGALSFSGGLVICAGNSVWLYYYLKYRRN